MTQFIQYALVFIASAIILVPIFHRLGLGSVLGYLMAGVLIGPGVFGLIKDVESVAHLGELGVVFLLFIIGLEIQPSKLWSMRRSLLLLGVTQVLVCTLVFAGALVLLHMQLTAAVIVGFALALSSTAFALQTLTERNQFSTDFGKAAFAVLLVQDMLAIPAMAIIPKLNPGTTTSFTWLGLLPFVTTVLAIVLVGRYLMGPLFRAIAQTRLRELFTAVTLLIVFGVASLMVGIGLSAALGTFMAGVLLADSDYRHELEADLEPFKGLLMGLFFIAVGLSVDVGLILKVPLTILALTAGYLVLKISMIYGIGRLNHLKHESAKLMSLNIGQGGEFAFVLLALALGNKLLDPYSVQMLTAVITLSMALNPIISKVNERLTKCDKNIPAPTYDVITNENPEVIIAGFGRFGQIFGRILRAQNIPFVAIDHDPEQIDLLRKFGHKVYYGDASRPEILETAGANKAKYFVLAIEGVEESLETAKTLRHHFPHLKIFARARNRGHAFDLLDLGIEHIKRETFDSSVFFVSDLLVEMGIKPELAQVITKKFKVHDELMMLEQYKVRSDDKMFVSVALQAQAQLEKVLSQDSQQSFIELPKTSGAQ